MKSAVEGLFRRVWKLQNDELFCHFGEFRSFPLVPTRTCFAKVEQRESGREQIESLRREIREGKFVSRFAKFDSRSKRIRGQTALF